MLTPFQRQKLPKLFAIHDLNRDGVINWKDFEEYALRIARTRGWGADSDDYKTLVARFVGFWTGLEQLARQRGARKVTLTEWLAYWDLILSTPGTYEQMIEPIGRMVFTILDQDGDDAVTVGEYRAIFAPSGIDPAEATSAFEHLDLNHDGRLGIDEILQLADQFFRSNNPSDPGNALFGFVTAPVSTT